MRSSILRDREALAQKVRVTADELAVDLVDGTVSVPVHWYPRLANGSLAERQNWQIIGQGRRDPLARPGRRHRGRRSAGRSTLWRIAILFSKLARVPPVAG